MEPQGDGERALGVRTVVKIASALMGEVQEGGTSRPQMTESAFRACGPLHHQRQLERERVQGEGCKCTPRMTESAL